MEWPGHYAPLMLILALVVVGLVAGAGAQLLLQRGAHIDWTLALVTGIVGSFLGGLFVSFLAGDGLELRPSGVIGSIFGAAAVTLGWDWFRRRGTARPEDTPRPHV
jgi:uncharacterized membrane protein YeaQ/YmgE (transglycosylase-associated protein family)